MSARSEDQLGAVLRAEVGAEPVDLAALVALVGDDRCGAVVTFDGVVRDHDEGRGVTRLEYTAHPQAGEVIRAVAEEVLGRHPECRIALDHRVGALAIGDSALGCAVASAHRAEAFAACADLVDTVKQRLPIWKHQHFTDGSDEWVGALG